MPYVKNWMFDVFISIIYLLNFKLSNFKVFIFQKYNTSSSQTYQLANTWGLKRHLLTTMLLRPCGVMAAHQTSDLGVAGSSPVKVGFLTMTEIWKSKYT